MRELKIDYGMGIYIFQTTYDNNGNLAIIAICDDGEPFGTITVNLHDLPKNLAYIDTPNMPGIDEVLVKNGIAKMVGMTTTSGFCEYTLFEFNVDDIPSYEEYEKYMEEYYAAT